MRGLLSARLSCKVLDSLSGSRALNEYDVSPLTRKRLHFVQCEWTAKQIRYSSRYRLYFACETPSRQPGRSHPFPSAFPPRLSADLQTPHFSRSSHSITRLVYAVIPSPYSLALPVAAARAATVAPCVRKTPGRCSIRSSTADIF